MLAEYTANNNRALKALVTEHKVDLRRFPDEVLQQIRKTSDEVVSELAAKDAMTKKVFDSFQAFRNDVMAWHQISEQAYYNTRSS